VLAEEVVEPVEVEAGREFIEFEDGRAGMGDEGKPSGDERVGERRRDSMICRSDRMGTRISDVQPKEG
jgi:hypothetical protein